MAQDPTTTAPRSTAAWKGVAAAGIGVALLAAGGATFAEWSDSEDAATGTRITAGVLDLEGGAGTWTNAAGDDVTADIEDGSYRVVPGDALTYSEELTIDARGDLLQATVSHDLNGLTGDPELIAQLTADASMSLNGTPVEGTSTTVVADDELQNLDVAVTVTFTKGTNELVAQGKTVELGGLDIDLVQKPVSDA